MLTDTRIVIVQVRLLQLTVLCWLAGGLLLGQDPLVVAVRAAAGGLVVCLLAGGLLRIAFRAVAPALARPDQTDAAQDAPADEGPA